MTYNGQAEQFLELSEMLFPGCDPKTWLEYNFPCLRLTDYFFLSTSRMFNLFGHLRNGEKRALTDRLSTLRTFEGWTLISHKNRLYEICLHKLTHFQTCGQGHQIGWSRPFSNGLHHGPSCVPQPISPARRSEGKSSTSKPFLEVCDPF